MTAPADGSSAKPYVIRSIVHATEVLNAFTSPDTVLSLSDIVRLTGLEKTRCFRLLYTLRKCGFLEKVTGSGYRYPLRTFEPKRRRVAYCEQGRRSAFADAIREGLLAAARQHGAIEVIVLNNRFDAQTAVRNARRLIRERVDLVIEFQTNEAVATEIASHYIAAGIPFIAIDIPHPGATFFGANNYDAGLLAGRQLGKWARTQWPDAIDQILLLELKRAGRVPQMRLLGLLNGLKQTYEAAKSAPVLQLDTDGDFGKSLQAARKYLAQHKANRVLIGAANDPGALGALRAFEEAGRIRHCAVVSHNAEPEARAEMRRPGTRLTGSVAYFPERYGDGLVRLAAELLAGRAVPPAVFIKHQIITPDNVDRHYPNDLRN